MIGYVLLTIGLATFYAGYPNYALLTLVPSLFLFGSDIVVMREEKKLKRVKVKSEHKRS